MTNDAVSRRVLITASVCGALGVAIGAFGAHGLEAELAKLGYDAELAQRRLAQFDTGVRYHLIHSVALLALAALPMGNPAARRFAARLFLAGIILFSGSLYALVITNQTKLGMVTPLGGLSWIVGWISLIWLARKPPSVD